ncbi:MAG TPA: hypothetical protein VK904_07335, partial [Miltoncostaeaceae bacterium]|nr:hypothetical protein [Miltoncostaeaceae bacterium]
GKLSEERERAAKARGEAAVAKFIADHIERVTVTFGSRIDGLDRMKEDLARKYDAIRADEAKHRPKRKKGEPEPAASPYVFGDAARILKNLRAEIDAVHVPQPAEVLEELLEQWVNQVAGKFRHTKGGGHYIDGRIEISMEMDWWGGATTKTTKNPEARLNAPRAPQVCDTLSHVLKDGRTINDLDIEKQLTVKVEHIDAGFAWSNYYYWVTFRYRDPKRVIEVKRDSRPIQQDVHEAEPAVERLVRSRVDLTRDMALTDLKPGKSEHLKPW